MEHTFETVEQADFDPPPGLEGWLYVAGFSPMLPDRLNVALLRTKALEEQVDGFVVCCEGPEEFAGEVVTAVHVLIPPNNPPLAAWMLEQLAIIERDTILDEARYWPLVDPILQTLWDEATPAARSKLCSEGGAPADLILSEELPREVHPILYRQISE